MDEWIDTSVGDLDGYDLRVQTEKAKGKAKDGDRSERCFACVGLRQRAAILFFNHDS